MNNTQVVISPITRLHKRSSFVCEEQRITNYFINNARKEHDLYKVRVFVACEPDSLVAIGFYSLVITSVALKESPEEAQEKFERVDAMPAIYLAGVARHLDQKGKGVGKALLEDAFKRALLISEHAGAYALVLDAKNEKLANIYEGYGFERFTDESLKMFIALKVLRDAAI